MHDGENSSIDPFKLNHNWTLSINVTRFEETVSSTMLLLFVVEVENLLLPKLWRTVLFRITWVQQQQQKDAARRCRCRCRCRCIFHFCNFFFLARTFSLNTYLGVCAYAYFNLLLHATDITQSWPRQIFPCFVINFMHTSLLPMHGPLYFPWRQQHAFFYFSIAHGHVMAAGRWPPTINSQILSCRNCTFILVAAYRRLCQD